MKKRCFIFVFIFCYFPFLAILPPLERELNLTLTNEQVGNALLKIQEQTGLVFSYKPSVIAGIAPITLQLRHKTVREALALMLPKHITYKSKNNYIILKERPEDKNAKKTEISGYVYDKETDRKLPNVTIYDKESLQSVTTDQYGYYSISVPSTNEKISINKENYQDTILHLADVKEKNINNITIAPVSEHQRRLDSTYWRDKLKDLGLYTNQIYNKFKGFINTINVRDTIIRPVQVSVLPFVGTNHKLSGNVVNHLSFNVLGGFAKGVKGFELGGLFNIDRENVKGTQIAGIFNIVGDTVKGTQIAGYFNITGNAMKGFQAAGLMNIDNGTMTGVQVASLLNINRTGIRGASFAGIMNISASVKGSQVAAIGNKNDTLKGLAIAGLFNATNYGQSSQVAGLFNRQSSGTTYFQAACLFNRASYVKGVQISLLNFADSAKGVPIGFFSFVKKGVHQIELSGDELFAANLSFRTGVPAFYNILTIGFAPGSDKHLWQFGYGAGTSFRITSKLRGDLTVSAHHVSSGGFFFGTNELYKAYMGIEYKFRKKFSLAAGPTFNILMSDALLPDYETYGDIAPGPLFNKTDAYDFNYKGWMGCRVALRFL